MMKTVRNIFIHFKKKTLLYFIAIAGFCALSSFTYESGNTQIKIIKCYPNPATSIINFEFDKSLANTATTTLQIYSFSGKKMNETPVSEGKVSFQLTNYYRGIYVYQLRDKDGKIIESGKFQVVK